MGLIALGLELYELTPTRLARRLPLGDPGTGPKGTTLFLEQNRRPLTPPRTSHDRLTR